jgi:phage gp46-like protein
MTDVSLNFNNNFYEYDIGINKGDLQLGNDLETAVIISLFTWARAKVEEIDEDSPLYGWWGDKIDEDSTDNTGSKLYLLKRKKITSETIYLAKEYIEQALQWMITDNVATEISVTVERNGQNRVDALVVIIKGERTKTMKFNDLWSFL